jgi:hypothetical protein
MWSEPLKIDTSENVPLAVVVLDTEGFYYSVRSQTHIHTLSHIHTRAVLNNSFFCLKRIFLKFMMRKYSPSPHY